MGRGAVKIVTLLVACALLAVSAIGIFYSVDQEFDFDIKEIWELQEKSNERLNDYVLSYHHNGTLYGFEGRNDAPDGRHFYYFIAIDMNGTVKWRAGVNARPYPVLGADDGFYYVDWPDVSIWSEDVSKTGWHNLTALDGNGNFVWDYIVQEGMLYLWGTFPDGTVIAHHNPSYYNQTRGTWVYGTESVIAISDNGDEKWSRPLPPEGYGNYLSPRIDVNGTFLVNSYEANASYEIGFNKSNGQMYVRSVEVFTGYVGPPRSRNGTICYDVRKEPIDMNRTVISVYATNITDGSQVWRTILHYSDNPYHYPPGSGWDSLDTIVDANGTIYCRDIEDRYVYGLNPDGTIRWNKTNPWLFQVAVPGGGVLVIDGAYLEKVDEDGMVVWKYDTGSTGSAVFGNVVVSPNGTVFFSKGGAVVALSVSEAGDRTLILLSGMTLLTVAVLTMCISFLPDRGKKAK